MKLCNVAELTFFVSEWIRDDDWMAIDVYINPATNKCVNRHLCK